MLAGRPVMGLGDVIILLIPAGIGLLALLIHILNRLEEKHDQKLVETAQNWELREGVTLLQGVRAYFGDEGVWLATSSHVYAWITPGDKSLPSAVLCLHPKTGQLEIYGFEPAASPVCGDGTADGLVDAMIQAARLHETVPEP